jgi:phosphoribosylformylglycinamidine synthase
MSGLRVNAVERIPLRGRSLEELGEMSDKLHLHLSAAEMKVFQDYFENEGRDPNDIELQALGQAWSEHCSYKSSKPILKKFIFPLKHEDEISRGDAGVMKFDESHAYALRIESHNHPSALEPYGGAATGIGGIIRDVLAMGAQPIALVDPLFFGRLTATHRANAQHSKFLFAGVVAGIRDYGNRVGIPTVAGCVQFHDGYASNCLVNVGCVGMVPLNQVMRNAVGGPGDAFILCGGKTGRDGIHGVTFASAIITDRTIQEERTAVQLGDPILKEPLIHACREVVEKGLATGLKDLGGGGLSCVVGEMALAGGCGAEIDLDKVPLKEKGMAPWEVWVSESQERMMIAARPENVEKILTIFDLYDVEANVVGRAIQQPRVKICAGGRPILDMEIEFYVKTPEYLREKSIPKFKEGGWRAPKPPSLFVKQLLEILSDPDVASKDWVVRQYDHEVRGNTILRPVGGLKELGHNDCAVLRPVNGSDRGLAISVGCDPYATEIDPYIGGLLVVDEATRNVAAVGARPHALTNCLNFGNPEKPEIMGQFHEVVRGMGEYCRAMHIAVPSGNVSFYNESKGVVVPPTAVVLLTGIVQDISKCVTSGLLHEKDNIYIVGAERPGMGGSLLYRKYGGFDSIVPSPDLKSAQVYVEALVSGIEKGIVSACHDVSTGGMITTLSEMCISGGIGAKLTQFADQKILFSESPTRWLIEVDQGKEGALHEHFKGLSVRRVGVVSGNCLSIGGHRIPVEKLESAWLRPLWDMMG